MTDPAALPAAPTLAPVTPLEPVEPARTIADVQADLILCGAELTHHRGRRGELTNNAERIAQRPALMVHELNVLLDEWARLNHPPA